MCKTDQTKGVLIRAGGRLSFWDGASLHAISRPHTRLLRHGSRTFWSSLKNTTTEEDSHSANDEHT